MMSSNYIVNVSEADFEYEVLAYSQQTPVIVDFWAEWCAPCRTLEPILEKLVEEAQGAFRMARVNIDENPNLARRYQVYSIPAVKAFRDGRIASEFTGLRPEPQVREFLRSLSPSPADLAVEKGDSLLAMHQPQTAEAAYRLALESFERHPAALLGLSRSLIFQDKMRESLAILRDFPASREYTRAETLRLLPEALVAAPQEASLDENPLEAAYGNALRLVKRGNLEAALDGLLDILRQDKRYRDGQARKLILAIFELLGEGDPTTQQYRSELASVLF
jgi:putative thioredoxin